MLLAEFLPQPNVTEVSNTMVRPGINDEPMKLPAISSESTPINDDYSSITSIKIPLVSFEPILATSPNYILVNEFTKRKNQFVLFNDHLQKFITRSVINKPILDALWYEIGQQFLILTERNIFAFYPTTKNIQLINDLMPLDNKTFKCFTLLNQSTLLIGYDEWNAKCIDKWEQNENGLWTIIERQQLVLTSNEFIGNMLTITEDDCTHIAITIYNNLTEQWRLELRNAETLICYKAILLPGSNVMHDYRIIPIKNAESNIKWLVFSSANSHIIAMDSKWKKIGLNYKNPVQRMAVFNENYLIIRTKERIDIHLFG